MNNKSRSIIRGVVVLGFVGLLLSCGSSDDDDEASVEDLAVPGALNCTDPAQCLSVTATWCAPGADTCASNDVDLSLILPGLATVGIRAGELATLNGCTHSGDEEADAPFDRNGDGDTGPFRENIACNPTAGPTPINAGQYMTQVRDNFSFFDTGPIVVDVFINGVNQRQIVNVDDGSTEQNAVIYP